MTPRVRTSSSALVKKALSSLEEIFVQKLLLGREMFKVI